MAGQDQSKNLSGMLSQMGASLGSMGGAADGLLRPIENTFRPQADPEDLGSMQNLMQWQQKMGREDAARTSLLQVNKLQEQQRQQTTAAARAKISPILQGISEASKAGDAAKLGVLRDQLEETLSEGNLGDVDPLKIQEAAINFEKAGRTASAEQTTQAQQIVQQTLSNFEVGSEQYEQVASTMKEKYGKWAVDAYEVYDGELKAAKAVSAETLAATGPLTDSEKERLDAYGISYTAGMNQTARQNLAKVELDDASKKSAAKYSSAATRSIKESEIKALGTQTLRRIMRTDQSEMFNTDLADIAERILDGDSEEELAAFEAHMIAEMPQNKEEAREAAMGFFRENYPDTFKQFEGREEEKQNLTTATTTFADNILKGLSGTKMSDEAKTVVANQGKELLVRVYEEYKNPPSEPPRTMVGSVTRRDYKDPRDYDTWQEYASEHPEVLRFAKKYGLEI